MKEKVYTLKEILILNIKYYRYLMNISQERLAELSNLSPRYITDVERGLHVPTLSKLERIANALNVEPYVLFMNTDKDEDILHRMSSGRQYNQEIN